MIKTPLPREFVNAKVSELRTAIGLLNGLHSSVGSEEQKAIDAAVNVLERRIYDLHRRMR